MWDYVEKDVGETGVENDENFDIYNYDVRVLDVRWTSVKHRSGA